MAIFKEKIMLKKRIDLLCCGSSIFGLTDLLKKKYNWAPRILHDMWIADKVYGYLKLTFANAALFKTVTRILFSIQTSSHMVVWYTE